MNTNTYLVGDNLQLLCSAAAEAADGFGYACKRYELIIRQQPKRSRVGSVSEKLDRRPIDPPPIIQLVLHDPLDPFSQAFTASPAFFMHVMLMDEAGETPVRRIKGHKAAAMAGSMVSPLHTLRDTSMVQGAYFVFSDLSVRMEGSFRLRFDLFENEGDVVHSRASAMSEAFSVYSPKRFPGMMESTRLSKLFADQGLRIRIRTEAGTKKRGKKTPGCSASKRPRQLSNSDGPCITLDIQAASDSGMVTHPDTSSDSSPASSLASGILGTSEQHNPGLLIFQPDPFSVYRNEGESVALPDQQCCPFKGGGIRFDSQLGRKQLANPQPAAPFYEPKLRHTVDMKPAHSLNLSDIAAVALLDSLSNGNPKIAPAAPSSSASHMLPPHTCVSLGYPPSFGLAATGASALAMNAPASNVDVSRAVTDSFQQPTDAFYSLATPSLHLSVPFSNYRITAARTPDSRNSLSSSSSTSSSSTVPTTRSTHDSLFNPGLFFGTPSRMPTTLRSSGLGLHTSGSEHSAFPQMPFASRGLSDSRNGSTRETAEHGIGSTQSSAGGSDGVDSFNSGLKQELASDGAAQMFGLSGHFNQHLDPSTVQTSSRMGLEITFPQPVRSSLLHPASGPDEPWAGGLSAINIGLSHAGRASTTITRPDHHHPGTLV